MARRLALLALLVCTAVAYRPLLSSNTVDSEATGPFTLWEEFDDTIDAKSQSRMVPLKHKTKVNLKSKPTKLNVTSINPEKKNNESDDKKKVFKTTINIASHTNFIVTDRVPFMYSMYNNYSTPMPHGNYIKIDDQHLWVNNVMMTPKPVKSKKPSNTVQVQSPTKTTSRTPIKTSHRVSTKTPIRSPTRVPTRTSTRKPIKTTAVTTTRAPTKTRRPATTARPRGSTKRITTSTIQYTTIRNVRATQKITKAVKKKKPCKPAGWLSEYFRENDVKIAKAPKKEEKSGFLSGIFSWLVAPWFMGGWFKGDAEEKSTSTTTTPYPPSTSTNSWFQNLLDSEENDDSHSGTDKKPRKKSLKKNYKGYQLLRTYADIQWKVRALLDLKEEAEGSGIMWWTPPSLNSTTDILVPPDLLVDVKDHLKSSSIDFDVIIWDLQKAIMYENPKMSKKQRLELEYLRGHPMTWRRYHRYADILRYLEYLQHSYSDIVELVPLGRTSEGLPLVAVKVSKASNETKPNGNSKDQKKKYKLRSNMKPAVWIEGGSHACEWIAPAVATWMLHHLVEGGKESNNDQDILNVADFYILPVLNPDGYEHTHTHDRLWKKTRSQTGERSDDYYVSWFPWNWGRTECVGVDADRNWDFHWGEKDSSRDECADNYAGQHPFSEPETRAVSEFLSEHRGQIKLYMSLHAYSQAWLLPSSHANGPFADDNMMMDMGKLATAALSDMYGTKYQVGTADEIRQPASGMSHDWAKARAGIKFAYHVDLRDSFGPYGFLLPGSQIVSTAKETWQAVRAIVDNLSPGY